MVVYTSNPSILGAKVRELL
ncbi:rCG38073 [Rattus norvegicus]|uniref:RCG38073 n=1 Tax=Rattus norvegicus TaxID=10116 RepID=A6IUZ0_RAT|nr:rCG38073 [Rattus norvegicus]